MDTSALFLQLSRCLGDSLGSVTQRLSFYIGKLRSFLFNIECKGSLHIDCVEPD